MNRKREYILDKLGGECNECHIGGKDNYVFLTIDHINNDADDPTRHNVISKLYPIVSSGSVPANVQILCNNCNQIKEHIRHLTEVYYSNIYYGLSVGVNSLEEFLNNQWIKKREAFATISKEIRCNCCGYDNIIALEYDHIISRSKFLPQSPYTLLVKQTKLEHFSLKDLCNEQNVDINEYWRNQREWSNYHASINLQILCSNCNLAKSDNDECPHRVTIIA